ncbi:uncharacterized protein [Rutidosis leptorrhynchoides]|uniref:uncharacterized protein isoform X2 n=1 Tax=Rutidosis leptorrhynchoides TaxID=125765 RepID=UPI003A9949B7
MGSDDDDNGNKLNESDSSTWDFGVDETQIFDSQISDSATSKSGNKFKGDGADQLDNLQSTVPFNDTVMFEEDALETQVMDPDGETQLLNLGDETQVVNFDAEFEVMDIPDSADKNETQLFTDFDTEEVDVSDNEGTEKTEIVDDSDLSDEDCGSKERANFADIKHTQNMGYLQDYNLKKDYGRSKQHTSGIGFKTFTSIRAASIRASGIAARNKTSQRNKSPQRLTVRSEPDIEHTVILSEKDQLQEQDIHDKQIDKSETGNRCRFGRSIARKLFTEDVLDETQEENGSTDPCEANEFAGLSYIDSQEPGDASQANALDFVDNFLKVNIECDNERDMNKTTGGKSKPVLSAKGTRTFAKSASLMNAVDEVRVFDWDDNLEDEGGEFFRKNKEAFFASGGRGVKSSISSGKGRKFGKSDSKLVLGKNQENNRSKKSVGTRIKDATFIKNLTNELDKQSKDMPGGMDIQETTVFRFDTQMAAEAMEDLCFGLQETARDSTKANSSCKQTHKASSNIQASRTTRSKSKRISDQSNEVKQAKSFAKKNVVAKESENFDVLSDVVKKRGKTSLKRKEVDTVDALVAVDQIVKKHCIQNVTPVARRTRQSVKDNEFEKVKDASNDHVLTGSHPKGKRTRPTLPSARQLGAQSVSRSTRSKAAMLTEQEKISGVINHHSVHGKSNERVEPSRSACTTPVSRGTPLKESSPICIGDEYLKQSCRRSSLIKEVMSLSPAGTAILSPNKDSRKRKDVSLICVLFSRHLDGDIMKQQKKILSRLGASETSSMSDATHFIADDFVRTRNMLEAIALGKPVVTHQWLESCGQACCHIDEKNFILRDAKKEKEFGFNLPASLARARLKPLLKGFKVLITPNTKPGKEILSSLVKAVHGLAVERMNRSGLKDDKLPEKYLILSCEEDYTEQQSIVQSFYSMALSPKGWNTKGIVFLLIM